MKIKLGLLKKLINEEAQKLDEAKYKVTRDDVKTLQAALNITEPTSKDIKVDGGFGKNTRAKLVRFQKEAGLSADGVAGPKVWRAMINDLRANVEEDDEKYDEAQDLVDKLESLDDSDALIGRRRRKKKKKKVTAGGQTKDVEKDKGRSAEDKKSEGESQARRALIQAEKLGAEVVGDRTGDDGAPLAFIIDRPDTELEAGANSVTADKLKDLMMKVFFGTQRMLDKKDIEVEILDPKKVDADVRPPELKGKIRLTVTGPARKRGKTLSDEEFAKLLEATEKLRVLREARRRK